jgi:hypothetical protein
MDQRCFGRLVAEMQNLALDDVRSQERACHVLYSQSSTTCLPQTTTRQDCRCRSESALLVFAAAHAAVCKPLGCWPGTPDRVTLDGEPLVHARPASCLARWMDDGVEQEEVEMKAVLAKALVQDIPRDVRRQDARQEEWAMDKAQLTSMLIGRQTANAVQVFSHTRLDNLCSPWPGCKQFSQVPNLPARQTKGREAILSLLSRPPSALLRSIRQVMCA